MMQVLQDGWRAFFLAATLFAVLAVGAWLATLGGAGDLPVGWHAHEMVFGLSSAFVAGFFLTAVPNWTGAPAARAGFIGATLAVWLLGRAAVWGTGVLPPALVAAADLAFLPLLAAKLVAQLVVRPKPQNLMLLGLLALVWAANLAVHLDWAGIAPTAPQGLRAGLLAVCALIAVLGGRVTPAFTRNALLRADPEARVPVTRRPLERAGIVLPIGTALAVLAGAPDRLAGALALAAGVATALRLAGWRGAATRGQPILWALHLAMGALALGYLAFGLAAFGLGPEVGALHLLGIGTIGGMTLAVSTRAALGHSGRALVAPGPVALAYALVPLAAVLRWGASAAPSWHDPLTHAAGGLWMLAFALAAWALWPVWTRPRAARAAP